MCHKFTGERPSRTAISITLQSNFTRKSMDWFLYDNGLRHERVKQGSASEYSQIA